jgi:hypothetical protein
LEILSRNNHTDLNRVCNVVVSARNNAFQEISAKFRGPEYLMKEAEDCPRSVVLHPSLHNFLCVVFKRSAHERGKKSFIRMLS